MSDYSPVARIQWGMEWLRSFPDVLARELMMIPDGRLCDIRLYANAPCRISTLDGEMTLQFVPDGKILCRTAQELCGNRLRISPEATGQGYITLQGGHRMGLCGRVTLSGKEPVLQEIGSVCIRVARSVPGCGRQTAETFMQSRKGILICGAPGSGKTTHLRDALRLLSDAGVTAGLSDERGEVAACFEGIAMLDVGERTHVLDGCPKAEALRWLLRGLCPQVLAMDELYGEEECEAIRDAAACGVPVIATVHGADAKALLKRAGVARLMEEGVFGSVVFLRERKAVGVMWAEDVLCSGR